MSDTEITIVDGAIVVRKNSKKAIKAPAFVPVTDIAPQKPGFLIRYGGGIIFMIGIVLLIICWFYQYPDIVTVNAKLTSINAPKTVVARTDGKLMQLLIREGQTVAKDDPIGYLESNADPLQVAQLRRQLDSLSVMLSNGQIPRMPLTVTNLGELQVSYQTFTQSYIQFRSYVADGFYLRKKKLLHQDIEHLSQIYVNLKKRQQLEEQDLQLEQETFKAHGQLHDEKVISPMEFRTEKSKLLTKQLALPATEQNLLLNENEQSNKQKEIMELDNTISQQTAIFLQAVNTLISQLSEWDKKYVLRAPIAGKVSFSTMLQEKMQLSTNQAVCYIDPGDVEYYAEAYIPQANFGKVKMGQPVILNFASYPSAEFGHIKGNIAYISRIPSDSGYMARIRLEQGLHTTYNKELAYREGLIANGQIITANIRLLKRLFINLRKATER